MTISELVERAFRTAKEHGWHDGQERSPLEIHALIHSEVGEATEEARQGNPPIYQLQEVTDPVLFKTTLNKITPSNDHFSYDSKLKSEGELIELVDVILRIADYCGLKGWDLETALLMKMKYNEGRSYRHGNKKY